jgi:GAF domain-containing protein
LKEKFEILCNKHRKGRNVIMIKLDGINKMNTEQRYKYMLILLEGQLSSEKDDLANLSNASAIIKAVVTDLNWAGFYFIRNNELILGTFQGLPACNRIKLGSGVCGSAVSLKKVQRIENVHEFPGHIACDSASNSELVIPLIKDGIVYGVLDLDSPNINRFGELEEKYFVMFVEKLLKYINWENV